MMVASRLPKADNISMAGGRELLHSLSLNGKYGVANKRKGLKNILPFHSNMLSNIISFFFFSPLLPRMPSELMSPI